MTAWAYQPPVQYLTPTQTTPDSASLPMSGTINLDDVLIISSGVVSQAATNPTAATLAGIALKKSADIYYNASPTDQTLFGASTVGTALTPSEPKNMQFTPFANGNQFVFSLVQAWNQNLVGTTAGLLLDGTSTFFVLDNSQGNKPFVIKGLLPNALENFQTNDTGVRVIAEVPTSTALGF